MNKITIHRATHTPTHNGLAPARVKRKSIKGVPLDTPSGPTRVIGGFNPDPWVIMGANGDNLSAFSCINLTLEQVQNLGGDLITQIDFNAVQIAFNWKSVDALLVITLFYSDGSGPFTMDMPINLESQTLTGTY